MSDLERPGDVVRDMAGLVVPSAPTSVGLVRRYAVEACSKLGWDSYADTVSLLVSEVATNAVLHAHGQEVGVRIRAQAERLRVEIDDGSPELPVQRGSGDDDEDGRGLALVEALALVWGVRARRGGKTFWFELGS